MGERGRERGRERERQRGREREREAERERGSWLSLAYPHQTWLWGSQ